MSPLYVASENGHLQIVQLLIEYGALVNQANTVSCVNKRVSIIGPIAKCHASLHVVYREFGSTIIIMVYHASASIIKFL